MYRTQTAYFPDVENMNDWLENFDGDVIDIKMTGTRTYVHYLVIYKKDFKENR